MIDREYENARRYDGEMLIGSDFEAAGDCGHACIAGPMPLVRW